MVVPKPGIFHGRGGPNLGNINYSRNIACRIRNFRFQYFLNLIVLKIVKGCFSDCIYFLN